MLDQLDRKILAILDWEARLPATQIARRVRSNKDVVLGRIRKLEERGVISHYYPVLNLCALGYYTHRLNFETVELTTDAEQELVRFLDKEIGAGMIYRMDAQYKYGIYLYTKSMYDLERLLLRIKKFLGSRLIAYRYNLLCHINQYPKDAVFGAKMHTRRHHIKETPVAHHDADDIKVLRELAKDARLSTAEISRRTRMPQQTVAYKIKAMERKGIINGYRAEIVIQKLGFEHWAFEVYLSDQSDVERLAHWAHADPHVTWFETSIGGMDVDFVLEAKDRNDLEEQLNELRRRFPSIRKLMNYPERYWKLTYLP